MSCMSELALCDDCCELHAVSRAGRHGPAAMIHRSFDCLPLRCAHEHGRPLVWLCRTHASTADLA